MNHHISSRPGGAGNTELDETPQRQRRFTDQRGIALQTVIIMVVMLAIAGGVAAVLMTRAGTATDQLEAQSFTADLSTLNETLCKSSGYHWNSGTTGWCSSDTLAEVKKLDGLKDADKPTKAECKQHGFGHSTDKCTETKPT